ncbi:hypothetical protein BDN67DRAFT_984842 [Paxillus ammoniavirescens]|nr:hypothetical protein BDN67DRAFT_984842 [Paxillus ammoniavirescens]
MVRTKQIAHKAAGGIAPHVLIRASALNSSSTPHLAMMLNNHGSKLRTTTKSRGLSSQRALTQVARDRGDLYTCDDCPRVICNKCLVVPSTFLGLVAEDSVQFRCGFHRQEEPVLLVFPTIKGHFEMSTKLYMHSTTTLIIHLRLAGIPTGGPMQMIQQFLMPYFPHGGLTVVDLEFNLGTVAKRRAYAEAALRIVSSIEDVAATNVLLAITNHMDESSGNLFYGKCNSRQVAGKVGKVMDVLLTLFRKVLSGAILFLLICGSILREHASCVALQNTIGRFSISSTIVFDVPRLQPIITVPFLINITESVIIKGHEIQDVVPEALGHSCCLGMHAGVLLMLLGSTGSDAQTLLNITKYIWSHKDYRPWVSPMWNPQKWHRLSDDSGDYTYKCRYKKCGRDPVERALMKSSHMYTFKKPKDAEVLQPGKCLKSAWL